MSFEKDNTVVLWRGTGEPWSGADYGSVLTPVLEASGYRVFPVDYMDPTADMDQIRDARRHVITGSSTSVHNTHPRMSEFLSTLEGILRRAQAGEATVAGVCFGSQAIATVFGGPYSVVRSEKGLDVGIAPVFPVSEQNSETPSHMTSHFHYEEIADSFVADPNVHHLFESAHSYVQGFRIGSSIYGYQFHADFDPSRMRALIDHYADLLVEFNLDRSAILQSIDTNAQTWDDHLLHATVTAVLERHA